MEFCISTILFLVLLKSLNAGERSIIRSVPDAGALETDLLRASDLSSQLPSHLTPTTPLLLPSILIVALESEGYIAPTTTNLNLLVQANSGGECVSEIGVLIKIHNIIIIVIKYDYKNTKFSPFKFKLC